VTPEVGALARDDAGVDADAGAIGTDFRSPSAADRSPTGRRGVPKALPGRPLAPIVADRATEGSDARCVGATSRRPESALTGWILGSGESGRRWRAASSAASMAASSERR
jgi:hypothetical protein